MGEETVVVGAHCIDCTYYEYHDKRSGWCIDQDRVTFSRETCDKVSLRICLPSSTTSAFISGLISELHDRVGKKAFGRVGLTFVIHEGMVSKYEWTDSTTVKPENGGGSCGDR